MVIFTILYLWWFGFLIQTLSSEGLNKTVSLHGSINRMYFNLCSVTFSVTSIASHHYIFWLVAYMSAWTSEKKDSGNVVFVQLSDEWGSGEGAGGRWLLRTLKSNLVRLKGWKRLSGPTNQGLGLIIRRNLRFKSFFRWQTELNKQAVL